MKPIQKIHNCDQLIEYFNKGNRVKYILFWGHQTKKDGHIGKQCFSQWFPSPFVVEGVKYYTAEHYMMAEKAKLFKDVDTFEEIIHAKDPGKAKHLGRTIQNFSEAVWKKRRFDIVVSGNMAKFSQNPDLRDFLVNTGSRVLIEASPKDRIWGIGLAENDPESENPNLWRGLNLLGFALMQVRLKLMESV